MFVAGKTCQPSCLRVRPGANLRVEHVNSSSLKDRLLALPTNIRLTLDKLERLERDKHFSLLRTFVNYGRKKFYNVGPWHGTGMALQ